MLYLAVVQAVASAAVILGVLSLTRSQQRSHARREDALIDRLLHVTGNTWTPPPADNPAPAPVIEIVDWTPSPEQLAV